MKLTIKHPSGCFSHEAIEYYEKHTISNNISFMIRCNKLKKGGTSNGWNNHYGAYTLYNNCYQAIKSKHLKTSSQHDAGDDYK